MNRTGVALLALVALLVAGATTVAAASAHKLVLSEDGVPLVPGASFEIYGYNALTVTTPEDGEVECEGFFVQTGVEVSVSTNSASKDQLHLERQFGTNLEPCRSFTGNASVSFSLTGPIVVRANGKASAGPAGLTIWYEHITAPNRHGEEVEYHDVYCVYSSKVLKGSNTAAATPQELGIELGGNLALNVSGSSENAKRLCSKKADIELALPSNQSETGVVDAQAIG